MKKLLLSFVAVLFLAFPVLAQKVRVFDVVAQTQTIRIQGGNVPVYRTFPSATVTVFETGTLTLASIWTNSSGSTPQANPFTANADATYGFFGTAGAVVDIRFSGGGITTPFTISSVIVPGGGGGGGGGDALTSNPLSQFAATTPAQLRSVITDDTGSGPLVFGTAPNITSPTGLVKADVGLGNVDNTSDATKNSATATLTNKSISGSTNTLTNLPAANISGVIPIANLAIGTPTGSKFIRDDGTLQTIPGGGDALTANPLSQFASTTSAQLAGVISNETGTPGSVVFSVSPAFTGTPTAPTAVAATNTTQIATTAHVFAERTNIATLTNKTLTSPVINTPTGIVKGDVGLGNVDNTSDANKPVSSATTTQLNLKAPLASPVFTGVPTLPTGTVAVTQSAGDNTTKLATTAFVTTADNLKANLASPTFTGTVGLPASTVLTTPLLAGASGVPGSCTVGQMFRDTSTTPNSYFKCITTNVWGQELVSGTVGFVSASQGGTGLVSSDAAGTITFSSATSASYNFSSTLSAAPKCTVTPLSDLGGVRWWITKTTTALTINASSSISAGFDYHCVLIP